MNGAPKLTPFQPWHLDLDQPGPGTPVDACCVGIARSLAPERALHLTVTTGLQHVVQREGFCFAEELASAEGLVAAPDQFRQFPLSSILSPGQINAESERASVIADLEFTSSREKNTVIDTIATASAKRFVPSLAEDVRALSDELFTNAIYNAPFVDPNSGRNPGIDRLNANEVKYAAGKHGRLVLAADQSRVVLGCVDPFGSLKVPAFLHRVKETYVRGPAATMNFGPGGAGLGSYIIFNTGSSLFLGVWEHQATALFCVIPLGVSQRKRAGLPKHLHWIKG